MDILAADSTFSIWLLQYGSFALFFLLALGIIAFPIPEETLMVLAGTLMFSGHLNIPQTIIAAFLGSATGITASYIIGRTLGIYFVTHYGKKVGITEEKLEKAHYWFERLGKWTLMVGYFIPGVRHFTGVCAGTTKLSFKHFALFAYSGAALWVATFLSLGYFFGDVCVSTCKEILDNSDTYIFLAIIIGAGLAAFILMKLYNRNTK